jgi:hypothetical protein
MSESFCSKILDRKLVCCFCLKYIYTSNKIVSNHRFFVLKETVTENETHGRGKLN